MYNWNTDLDKFENPQDRRAWELVQMLNYGLYKGETSGEELKRFWPVIKDRIDVEKRRLMEYVLWGKLYSLPIKREFWQKSKLQVL